MLELWSLFDFLLPGFLGTQRQFNERFGKPILLSRYAKSSSKEQEAGYCIKLHADAHLYKMTLKCSSSICVISKHMASCVELNVFWNFRCTSNGDPS